MSGKRKAFCLTGTISLLVCGFYIIVCLASVNMEYLWPFLIVHLVIMPVACCAGGYLMKNESIKDKALYFIFACICLVIVYSVEGIRAVELPSAVEAINTVIGLVKLMCTEVLHGIPVLSALVGLVVGHTSVDNSR